MADPKCPLQQSEKERDMAAKHCRATVGEIQPIITSSFVRAESCILCNL